MLTQWQQLTIWTVNMHIEPQLAARNFIFTFDYFSYEMVACDSVHIQQDQTVIQTDRACSARWAWAQNVENECKLRRRVESECDLNTAKMRVMCVGIRIKSRVISCGCQGVCSFCVIREFITLIQAHGYTANVQLYGNVCGEQTRHILSIFVVISIRSIRTASGCLLLIHCTLHSLWNMCVLLWFWWWCCYSTRPHARNTLYFNEYTKSKWERCGKQKQRENPTFEKSYAKMSLEN